MIKRIIICMLILDVIILATVYGIAINEVNQSREAREEETARNDAIYQAEQEAALEALIDHMAANELWREQVEAVKDSRGQISPKDWERLQDWVRLQNAVKEE